MTSLYSGKQKESSNNLLRNLYKLTFGLGSVIIGFIPLKYHGPDLLELRRFFQNFPPQTKCSVYGSNEVRPFMYFGAKYYWTCNVCNARILSCQHWLSEEDEFKYYQTHQNISSDPAYQRFAAQLVLPILEKLVPYSRGLGFWLWS